MAKAQGAIASVDVGHGVLTWRAEDMALAFSVRHAGGAPRREDRPKTHGESARANRVSNSVLTLMGLRARRRSRLPHRLIVDLRLVGNELCNNLFTRI